MSSFDRRGKYSTYNSRDNFKSGYSGNRPDDRGRDHKLRRSRSKDRFERAPLSLGSDARTEISSSRPFEGFSASFNVPSNSFTYEGPPRDNRQEYESFREGNRFEEPRNYREETFPTRDNFKDNDREFYRSRDRYSPGSVFNRLDGGDNRFEPPQPTYEEPSSYRREYEPPSENANWDPVPSDSRFADYSNPKNQMSLNEPSYMNITKERDISSEIPEFDPDITKMSARQWLQVLSDVGDKENWNGDVMKFWFANKITGSAKNFLNFGNIMQEKWQNIKKAFIKTYPSDMDYHHLLTEMLALVQGENENFLNYFNAKLAAIKTCEIAGKKAISLLIGGLYDKNLRNTAFGRNFDTPEELFNFLNQKLKESTSVNLITTKNENFNRGQDRNSRDNRCPVCGSSGHNSENCDTRKQCSRKEKTLLAQQDVISKTITWPKFMVDVKVNGRYLRGYADLDSEEITITEEAAKSINLSWRKSNRSFRTFGSNMIRTRGETEILLRVQKATATTSCFIVSDKEQAFPIVIGKSFGTLPNIRFDINEHQIEFYERDSRGTGREPSPQPQKKYRRDDRNDNSKPPQYDSNKRKHVSY